MFTNWLDGFLRGWNFVGLPKQRGNKELEEFLIIDGWDYAVCLKGSHKTVLDNQIFAPINDFSTKAGRQILLGLS